MTRTEFDLAVKKLITSRQGFTAKAVFRLSEVMGDSGVVEVFSAEGKRLFHGQSNHVRGFESTIDDANEIMRREIGHTSSDFT